MTSITLAEAQQDLRSIILAIPQGEELIIVENDKPLAIVSPTSPAVEINLMVGWDSRSFLDGERS